MHAARAAFEEKIKAFKMPEDMQEKWADLEGEWNQWLAQATAASKAIAGLLAAVKAAASLDAATAFGEKVAAAKERAHQEYLASLVVQLDARALKSAWSRLPPRSAPPRGPASPGRGSTRACRSRPSETACAA